MKKLVPGHCPLIKSSCVEDQCPFWLRLDDWQGCSIAGAQGWLYDMIKDGAKTLDKLLGTGKRSPPEDKK